VNRRNRPRRPSSVRGGSGITPLYYTNSRTTRAQRSGKPNAIHLALCQRYRSRTGTSCFVTSSTRSNARIIRTRSKVVHTLDKPTRCSLDRRVGVRQPRAHQGTRPPCRKGRIIRSRCSYVVRHHFHLARSARLFLIFLPLPPFSLFAFARGWNRPAGTSHCGRGEKGWYETGRNRWYPQGARIY